MVLLASAATCATCTPFTADTTAALLPVEAGPRCDPATPFGVPELVPGLDVSSATAVADVRLSPDSLTAYLSMQDGPGDVGYYDLYTASRGTPSSPFGTVVPLPGSQLNTTDSEASPTVSGDGLTLIFQRMTPSTDPAYLYYATRVSPFMPFTAVAPLPGIADLGVTSVTTPFLREDGQVLYFVFVSLLAPTAGTDIYRASWNGSTLDPPVVVRELDTSFSELAPVVTPDDLTVYFASDRGDGGAQGNFDIWTATREHTTDPFSTPVNVKELNTPGYEAPTFVTRDGCTLYLTSSRGGKLLAYVATKR
jgi:Tol biopolymer transport system component